MLFIPRDRNIAHMKDIVESARVAAREAAVTLWRTAVAVFCGALFCGTAAFLAGAIYFGLRWLLPHMSDKDAITIAVMTTTVPAAALGWFAILFSVELERRRKRREKR